LDIELRILLKFGEATASHILTTSLRGELIVDTAEGRVVSLALDTVSGCLQVQGSNSSFVTLNDLHLSVLGSTEPER
jgi:hypothetical protein